MGHRIPAKVIASFAGTLLLCAALIVAALLHQQKVYALAAPAPIPSSQSNNSPTAPATRRAPVYPGVLKRGDRGGGVMELQKRLNALGYAAGSADGIFGSGTEKAVKAFQRAKGLTVDGIVGRKTFDALWAAGATATPTATTVPTAKPSPTVSPVYGDDEPALTPTPYGKLDSSVTLKTGSTGADVRDLQLALKQKGFLTAAVTSQFGAETKAAVQKFQKSVGLGDDGVAGNYTLCALYSLLNPPDTNSIQPYPDDYYTNSRLPAEELTWAQADAEAFPRRSDAIVVDVRSGYSFAVRRTGGTKHADVETLTAVDTAAFALAASNFSWARRPIWVIVGDRRLAASMNCMPHGYDSIAGNDMKGQFCIHFLDSRTHGSDNADPLHREAIEESDDAGQALREDIDEAYGTDGGASQLPPA